MYRFIIDHKLSRALKKKQSSRRARKHANGFDLGAGGPSCVTCAYILPTGAVDQPFDPDRSYDEVPHLCARFVDSVLGAPIECFVARTDEELCGPTAVGWDPATEAKEDAVVVEDLLEDAPPCCKCFHYVESYDSGRTRDPKRCARYLDAATGETFPAETVRLDEDLCGPSGAWFKPAKQPGSLDPLAQEWSDVTDALLGEE